MSTPVLVVITSLCFICMLLEGYFCTRSYLIRHYFDNKHTLWQLVNSEDALLKKLAIKERKDWLALAFYVIGFLLSFDKLFDFRLPWYLLLALWVGPILILYLFVRFILKPWYLKRNEEKKSKVTSRFILPLFVCFFVLFVLFQVCGYVPYLLHRDFIMANLRALPLNYRVALGYGQWAWWSFVISGVAASTHTFWLWRILLRHC